MRGTRFLIYMAAAGLLILTAGCGWTSGPTFLGDYDPQANTPETAIQKWFISMEWPKTADEEGKTVIDREQGRDFDLYLEVIDPDFLKDPFTGQVISLEDLQVLRDEWNSKDWEMEFHDVQLQKAYEENGQAKVELISGNVRYIGDRWGTKEYKMDDFATKKGEIYLRWYDDPTGDPLLIFKPDAAVPRWVVTGGLDLSEDEAWANTQ